MTNNMNIHPIFVHFPIALLTLYSFFECFYFRKLINKEYWFFVKAILVVMGTLGGFFALSTGDLAKNQYQNNIDIKNLIEIHSNWAAVAISIYSIISFVYIIKWFDYSSWLKKYKPNNFFIVVRSSVSRVIQIFLSPWILITLAGAGFVTITIAGALGGAIVYGPDVDPVVKFIYQLFFS